MHCLLFRHGIAETPNTWSGDEHSRPLTKEGVTKTEQAVKGLKTIGVKPTHLLCSPLTRTRQTAGIAKNILTIRSEIEIVPDTKLEMATSTSSSVPEPLFSTWMYRGTNACPLKSTVRADSVTTVSS